MNNKYQVVIGIENHIQLKTKTKMFSPAPISFSQPPNSQVHPLDIGYPGALPTVNKKGVELAILTCLALHMRIDDHIRFDRKNYYYSDLSKGFQISQQFNPLGRDGYLQINVGGKNKKITIEKAQIEEDTAKQIHKNNYTGLNYNRSGIGLVEVVSCPVIKSAEEAVCYVKTLREIVMFAGISDGKMAEGSFRCDINISLQTGNELLSNKVEIKNLNSYANIRTAIAYEIKRQTAILDKGDKVQLTTRRFDEATQTTVLMRTKEKNIDYRFFTEPNIQPITISKDWIKRLQNEFPLLPDDIRDLMVNKHHLPLKSVNILLQHVELWHLFAQAQPSVKNVQMLLNYIIGDVLSYINTHNIDISSYKKLPTDLSDLINKSVMEQISSKQAKFILQTLLASKELTIDEVIKQHHIVYINTREALEPLVQKVMLENVPFIKQNLHNPIRLEKFLVGKMMQLTKGNCSPKLTKIMFAEQLGKIK